jgi:hypothetical protein
MRRFFPILGTLGLAILGSALWEALRKPIILLSFVLLRIITLGIDSLRDSIYADAAAQVPERASTLILLLLIGIVAGVTTSIMHEYRKRPTRDNEWAPLREARGSSDRKTSIAIYSYLPIVLMLSLFITANRQLYVIRASAYANQLQQIAAPFLTDKQVLQYSSAFAKVQKRSDYVELVAKLRTVISSNKASSPTFTIF